MRGEDAVREVEAMLDAATDAETRLGDVARLLVPQIAGACLIHLVDDRGQLTPVAVAHSDATSVAGLRDQAAEPRGPLQPVLWDALRARAVRRLEAPNAIVAPLYTQRADLGTFLLVLSGSRRPTSEEVELVRRLASRISIAIDYGRALREAAAARNAKSDFLALMSHELKTPLNIILGYADLLLRGVPEPLPDSARRQVERLRGGAVHLLALIDEVLTLARLEAGEERVRVADVSLHDIIRDVIGIAGELVADRALRFTAPTAPATPVTIRTDAVKLRQILLELVTNAVKFTPEGEVAVEVATSPGRVTVRIRDTGMGMAPESLQKAFEAFWQEDRSMTRRAGGSGLGLAVAARLTRLLGGELGLSSEPGKGTIATLELPWDLTPSS